MKKFISKGFTLIELLIVIALLGALAIGLIGALDPFEQLKKGTDTGVRNTVSEVHSSIIRYYALKGHMPWCVDNLCTTFTGLTEQPSAVALTATGMDSVLSSIVETGELKSNFTAVQAQQLEKIFLSGDTEDVTVCFQPDSKSFRSDNNSVYNSDGSAADPAICPGDNTSCYWCVK